MHPGGGKLNENTANQAPRVNPPEGSDRKVSDGTLGAADQPGGGHDFIAPSGVCFGCDKPRGG